MKHKLLVKQAFMIVLMAAITMGCKKDDGDDGIIDTSAGIEGTWELTALSFTYKAGPLVASSVGQDINDVLLTINSDGTTTGNGKTFDVETSIAGTSGSASTESELIVNEGEWRKNGNTFTWTGQGDSRDFTIRELTGTSLHLTGDYGDEIAFGRFNSIDMKFTRK